jgi:hypothetical protein
MAVALGGVAMAGAKSKLACVSQTNTPNAQDQEAAIVAAQKQEA